MAVCGVDFGCLNATVAQAERGGVTVLLNENSKRLNANMVSIQGKQRFIGESAASIAKSNYKNTARNLRRFMGKQFSECTEEMKWMGGVKFVEMPDGTAGVEVNYDDAPLKLSMQQLAGMMLFRLSNIAAESNKGVGIADLVVSVPAWFDDAQRLAMLDACQIAGFKCLRLMHDTTATALEYGIWRSMQKAFDEGAQRVMFCDVGFSGFQVSVVEYVKGKLSVKATTYDADLGGRDFDAAIAGYIAAEFSAKYKGKDPMAHPKARMKLFDAAEKAKKTLSPAGVLEATIFCECLMDDLDFAVKLSLEKFEELVEPLLARFEAPVLAALKEADEMDASALHSVEVVGGGSRVSSVKRRLAGMLGLDATQVNCGLKTTLNADEATSKGCAMMASILSPRFKVKDYDVVDAAPYAVSLSWESTADQASGTAPMETEADPEEEKGDEVMAAPEGAATSLSIFPKNADFPAIKRVTFRRDKSFALNATYDANNIKLGAFRIELPESQADVAKVRVHVEYTGHGTLAIRTAQLVSEVQDDDAAKASSTADEAKGDPSAAASSSEAKDDAAAAGETKDDASAATSPDGVADKAPALKKRKYKKTPLAVTMENSAMDKAAMDAAIELEAQMANTDRVLTETADMRNEVETYIYKMRDDGIGHLRPFVSDDDKTALEKALTDAETWLYEGDGYDTTKSNYAAKLDSLHKLGDPLVFRFNEAEKRPAAVSTLEQKLAALATFVAAPPDFVPKDDVATVTKVSQAASTWLADLKAKQDAQTQYSEPALTTSMLVAKCSEVDKATKTIVNKKPPAPAPAPAPDKDAEAKKADEPATDEGAQGDKPDGSKADVDMEDAKADDATASEVKDEDMTDAEPQQKD